MPIPEPIIRVTARDMQLGEQGVQDLRPGQFVVVCAEPLYVAAETRNEQGDIVLTLKRRADQDESDTRPNGSGGES